MTKPTKPFGYIIFGKDGSVRPDIRRLPGDQKGQESGVADRFRDLGGNWLPDDSNIRMLAVDDNDFEVIDGSGRRTAVVECTEIVLENYAMRLSHDEYRDGIFPEVRVDQDGYFAIDDHRRSRVIAERVQHKLSKHYAKPVNAEFWLIVWSVTLGGSYWQQGAHVTSAAVRVARDFIRTKGPGPFDKVFFFDMHIKPELIWSAEQAAEV